MPLSQQGYARIQPLGPGLRTSKLVVSRPSFHFHRLAPMGSGLSAWYPGAGLKWLFTMSLRRVGHPKLAETILTLFFFRGWPTLCGFCKGWATPGARTCFILF